MRGKRLRFRNIPRAERSSHCGRDRTTHSDGGYGNEQRGDREDRTNPCQHVGPEATKKEYFDDSYRRLHQDLHKTGRRKTDQHKRN